MSWCNHIWESNSGFDPGLVDYGGVIVYGTHILWKCSSCGKQRYKVFTRKKFKVYKRKELADYRESFNYKKPHRQMEFI